MTRAGGRAIESVSRQETQAQIIAHILDDALRLPGTNTRIGADPLLGVVPLFGDATATVLGIWIVLLARQLGVPVLVLVRMTINMLLNGVIGAVPLVGDLFSVWFRSNAKNAALLVRAIAKGHEGACPLAASPLRVQDLAVVFGLTAPVVAAVAAVSYALWERRVSLF